MVFFKLIPSLLTSLLQHICSLIIFIVTSIGFIEPVYSKGLSLKHTVKLGLFFLLCFFGPIVITRLILYVFKIHKRKLVCYIGSFIGSLVFLFILKTSSISTGVILFIIQASVHCILESKLKYKQTRRENG